MSFPRGSMKSPTNALEIPRPRNPTPQVTIMELASLYAVIPKPAEGLLQKAIGFVSHVSRYPLLFSSAFTSFHGLHIQIARALQPMWRGSQA
eukprot:6071699-Amphidinium_carterae.1